MILASMLIAVVLAVGFIFTSTLQADRLWEAAQQRRAEAAKAKYALVVPNGRGWLPQGNDFARVIALVDGEPRPCDLHFVDDEPYVFALHHRQIEADRVTAGTVSLGKAQDA